MIPDLIAGVVLILLGLIGMCLAPRRPKCSRCGRKLPRAEAMAERYSGLSPDGTKLAPLCLACFMGTFR